MMSNGRPMIVVVNPLAFLHLAMIAVVLLQVLDLEEDTDLYTNESCTRDKCWAGRQISCFYWSKEKSTKLRAEKRLGQKKGRSRF